jgi:hypothetical protein
MPKVYLVGGYARSGKTTLLKQAKEACHLVASTGQELYEIAARAYLAFHSEVFEPSEENIQWAIKFLQQHKEEPLPGFEHLSGRQFVILMAENVIVPAFGRSVFVKRAATKVRDFILSNGDNTKDCFVETVGGEEFQILFSKLVTHLNISPGRIKVLNLRRPKEQPGIDLRQLVSEDDITTALLAAAYHPTEYIDTIFLGDIQNTGEKSALLSDVLSQIGT